MDKKELLEHLELYQSVLSYIDKKTSLLEYSDREVIKLKKQLTTIKNKFSGINFLIKWVVFAAISLVPLSLLNPMIETDFNFIILAPFVSLIALFLYKVKYSQNTQKTLISSTKDSLSKVEKENKELIGEINYSKKMADELLEILLLYQPKENEPQNLSIIDCKDSYVNTTALYYSYTFLKQTPCTSFEEAIKHFDAIIEDISKKQESDKNKKKDKDMLVQDYQIDNLKSQLRKGVILRCERCQEIKETTVDKSETKK